MLKFTIGVVFGIVLATAGVQGIFKMIDGGVHATKAVVQEQVNGKN